jgi:hypothetical protein
MSVTLWTALLLQVIAIMLLRLRLGKLWLRRPAVLLVLISAFYNGASQVLLTSASVRAWDFYRTGLRQSYADDAALIMSAGMLAFTITYLIARPRRLAGVPDGGAAEAARALDWRWLALACVPLAVATYQGRGYNSSYVIGAGAPPAASIASTFFVLVVILAAFGFVLRHGHFLPVLITQSLLLATTGERNPIAAADVALILLLCHAGRRPRARDLHVTAALTLAAMLAITGMRAERGRTLFTSDSGLSARVSALASGVTAPPPIASPGLAAQVVARMDGVGFAGGVLQSVALGQPRLSPSGVAESLLIAVPSAAWPSKISHTGAVNPTQMELADFGMQDYGTNSLPTLTGIYMGFLPPALLIGFLGALGAAWGLGERWLALRWTPARLVLMAGGVTAVFNFEAGLPGLLLALRSAVAVAVIVKGVSVVRSRQVQQRRRSRYEVVASDRSDGQ